MGGDTRRVVRDVQVVDHVTAAELEAATLWLLEGLDDRRRLAHAPNGSMWCQLRDRREVRPSRARARERRERRSAGRSSRAGPDDDSGPTAPPAGRWAA
jgi:hypothetical protein